MIRPEYCLARVRLHLPSGPVLVAQTEAVGGHGAYPPDAAGEPITIITAHNPAGRPYPIWENRAFNARLVTRLGQDGLTFWPAAGGDADWVHVEESVAIPGLDPELALALGRDFGQDAVFVWTPTEWQVISCTDGTVIRRGWQALPITPELGVIDEAYRELGLRSPHVPMLEVHVAVDRRSVDAPPERRVAAEERERRREELRREAAARARWERQIKQAEITEYRRCLRAGWPRGWRPATVSEWQQLGGTREQAAAFDDAGWPLEDVLRAARAAESAAAVILPGSSPELYEEFGDDPADVFARQLPAIPPGTTIVVKRLFLDGHLERWHVSEAGDAVAVTRATLVGGGPWRTRKFGTWPTTAAAFGGVAGLRRVPADAATEIHAPGADWTDLVPLLSGPPQGIEDDTVWGPVLAEDWIREDEWLASTLRVPARSLVHLRVNGHRPIPYRQTRPARWLVIDLDDEMWSGAHRDELDEIVTYTWSSESNGAPISWDGGNSLSLVGSDVVVDLQWGDYGYELRLHLWPTSPIGRAAVIAGWVDRLELDAVAALTLEPAPAGTLDDWYAVEISMGISTDDETVAALRRRLARSSSYYRKTREAIRHARSVNGRKLRAALNEAAESGFNGWIYGSWLDTDLQKGGSR